MSSAMYDQIPAKAWQPTFTYSAAARTYAFVIILAITGGMAWAVSSIEPGRFGLRLIVLVIGLTPWCQVVAALNNPVSFRIADDTVHATFYFGRVKTWAKSDLVVRPPSVIGLLLRTHEVGDSSGRLAFRVWPNLDDCEKFLGAMS